MLKKRKWAVIGRLAGIVLANDRQRSRLVAETELADRLGLSRGALRNYADAVRLVRQIHDWGLRSILLRSSATGASAAARWHLRDPDGLFDYLQHGGLADIPPRIVDDRKLIRAARAARSTFRRPHRFLPAEASTQLSSLDQNAPRNWRWELRLFGAPPICDRWTAINPRFFFPLKPEDSLSLFLGIGDILVCSSIIAALDAPAGWEGARGSGAMNPHIAFIEVPEMVTIARYRAEARAIFSRALAASLSYPLVVLVMPNGAARRHLRAAIASETADWEEEPCSVTSHRGRHFRRSRPILSRGHKSAGTILITTRISLLSDLFSI